jgi:hypothetical protein
VNEHSAWRPASETDPEPLPIGALREHGLLWLINRTVFHPRGYALSLHASDRDGRDVVGWSMQGDGSEPWTFTSEVDDEQFQRVARFFEGLS